MISTYLLLLFVSLLMINIFVYNTIKANYLKEKENHLLTQANILANRARLLTEADYGDMNFDTMLGEIARQVQGRILIVDREAVVRHDSFNHLQGDELAISEVQRALKGASMAAEHNLPTFGRTMYVGVPVYEGEQIVGAIFLSVSLREIYQSIRELRTRLLLISFGILIMTSVISVLFAKVISDPIKSLTVAMQNSAQGKLNEKLAMKGNDEIGQLIKAFNYMNTKLSHIEKQRRDFVANVSHELKTPLSSMKLLSESLLIQPHVPEELYREFLTDIDSEIDRLNQIIESLLEMVDLDEEKLTLDYKLTYVNYLVEKVVGTIKPLAGQKDIKLLFNQWEKIQIYLDQGKIHQALINIVHNAVKYTEAGGKVVVDLYREGEFAIIKITDNGIGISEESLPYIFERFYRVDSARSRKTGGSGLGLSISHQIISLHQGVVEVESKLSKGTTFWVKLPMNTGIN